MRGRVGVALVVLGLFAAGLAAGAIRAGATVPPPPTEETTTEPSTTDEATTTTIATTTTPATSTTTTTVAPTPARNEIEAGPPIGSGACLVAAFALQAPDGQTRVLGRAAESPHVQEVVAHDVAYPADGSIVTAASVSLRASGCGRRGHAEVRSLSLFGGVVTARSVALAVSKRVADSAIRIDGLAVAGKAATLRSGRPLSVGNWGYATTLVQPDHTEAGAIAVHLTKAHGGLPAGTVLLVSFARAPREKEKEKEKPTEKAAAPASRRAAKPTVHRRARAHKQRKAKPPKRHRHRARKRLGDEPLTVTPPLGVSHYIFPVAGESSYIDTYGGFRGDVPGNWHHGDDIFAALGTPVLAVADGTLNRVGWQHLGGWRLWVRDAVRNEFYYAHLSGYSPLALRSRHVKAGDVIGFIGNTGDAFTTPPHLHFEIHPHQLLRLDYNGAVNPTRYLDGWQHIARPRTPKPEHPPFPLGAVRAEVRYVWRQLLAARGLIPHAPRLSERPHIRVPRPDRAFPARGVAAATVLQPGHDEGTILLDVLVGLFAPALLFGAALLFRLRRRPS